MNEETNHKAGKKLDALIAEIMDMEPAPYSTDLAAAVQVAEKLREKGWLVVMKWMPAEFYFMMGGGMVSEYDAPQPPAKMALRGKTVVDLEWMRKTDIRFLPVPRVVSANTPALAICRAAVNAERALREYLDRVGR